MQFSCKLTFLLTMSNISFCFLTSSEPSTHFPSPIQTSAAFIFWWEKKKKNNSSKIHISHFLSNKNHQYWYFSSRVFFTPVTGNELLSNINNLIYAGISSILNMIIFIIFWILNLFLLKNFNIKTSYNLSLSEKEQILDLQSHFICFFILFLALLFEQAVHTNNLHFITYYSIHISIQSLLALAIVGIMKDY